MLKGIATDLAALGIRHIAVENGPASSSVHSVETSLQTSLHLNYAVYSRRDCLPEWDAAYASLSKFYEGKNRQSLVRFLECRTSAWFHRGMISGTVKLISNACHHRWCPVCQNSKRLSALENVKKWADGVQNLKFLTLTLRSHTQDLGTQITRMYEAFRAMRRESSWRKLVHGGVYFFQVTYNRSRKQWHPHIHCLLDSDFIHQQLIADMWHRHTGDSYVIDIRSVEDTGKAVEYVARYVSRPGELRGLDLGLQVELIAGFAGRRICGTFGTARNVRLSVQVPVSTEEFTCIGSWRSVTRWYNKDPHSYLILYAWSNALPLPSDVTSFADRTDKLWHVPLRMADDDPF